MKEYKTNILLADNNILDLMILQSIFAPLYQVRFAKDARDVINASLQQVPDLIISNTNLGDMNGLEVLNIFKQDVKYNDVPMIFLSDEQDDDKEIEYLNMGASDYIRKPCNPKLLLARVERKLDLYGYRHILNELVKEKTEIIVAQQHVMLQILSRVTEFKDEDAYNHIARIMKYVQVLIRSYNHHSNKIVISVEDSKDLVFASQLHDIGKVAIPDDILLKKGRLTEEEFEIMKMHCDKGYDIINESLTQKTDSRMFEFAREIILCHHERWDGSGYPAGISGDDIPLSAQILSIADMFDALISKRPYKEPLTPEETKHMIKECSDINFSSFLIEVFLDVFEDLLQIAEEYQDE